MEDEKINKKRYLRIGEACRVTGLSEQTLRKMVDEGKIKSYKTPAGQRRIDTKYLQEMCLCINLHEKTKEDNKTNYIYARVSSRKQLDDLDRQIKFLKSQKPEYLGYDVISDVSSGLNFKRKGIETILDKCLRREIGEVIIAHKDRLCRFGFELIERLVTKSGGKIIVIKDSEEKTSEQELAEDLLSIVHIFSCRQMGKRKYTTNKIEDIKSEDLSNLQTETDS